MQPLFLPGEGGNRFCLFHAPMVAPRGAIIYLHPFSEEMNKSRRMAALQSRALADEGYFVLQIDLFGCGDSAGDFSDATWDVWQADVLTAFRWLRDQTDQRITLWGLRAGCLLAASVLSKLPEQVDLLFWHPVISGKQHLQQFFRLKLASGLSAGKPQTGTEQLRSQLSKGHCVEVAGYTVSPGLSLGMENASLVPTVEHSGELFWFELSPKDDASILPASKICAGHWEQAGYIVDQTVVRGPGFWQTAEIEVAPALLLATQAALRGRR